MRLDEKPPDYASVVDVPPPSYDDAIKLDPQRLIDSGHRAARDTCAITMVPPDECDKTLSANEVVVSVVDTTVSQPTIKLTQVIRKSIRDIRKQLTNTVSDGAVDVEQQQQSGSAVHSSDATSAALRKSNAQTVATNAATTD